MTTIRTLACSDCRANASLYSELLLVASFSYVDPRPLLDHELAYCEHLDCAFDEGKVVAYFLTNNEFVGRSPIRHGVYLGFLCATPDIAGMVAVSSLLSVRAAESGEWIKQCGQAQGYV